MSDLVRKQIYISKRQEHLLKRLSRARGVSEAEIVRSAIDRELNGETNRLGFVGAQNSALQDFIRLARSQRELTGTPFQWNRSNLYAEREDRWISRKSDEKDDAAGAD